MQKPIWSSIWITVVWVKIWFESSPERKCEKNNRQNLSLVVTRWRLGFSFLFFCFGSAPFHEMSFVRVVSKCVCSITERAFKHIIQHYRTIIIRPFKQANLSCKVTAVFRLDHDRNANRVAFYSEEFIVGLDLISGTGPERSVAGNRMTEVTEWFNGCEKTTEWVWQNDNNNRMKYDELCSS